MELALWSAVFLASLFLLIRGADLFLRNAERVGIVFGLSPFVIGVLIVGIGTSLPELVSAIVAVLSNAPEIVTGNAIGSNIANMLLVGGIMAVAGKRLVVDRDLLDAELPFFVISTALFLGIVFDAEVTVIESVLLAGTYAVYLFYLFSESGDTETMVEEIESQVKKQKKHVHKLPQPKVVGFMLLGLAGLLLGAKYLIDAVVELAKLLQVSPGLISITAIALGTSLPELSVSLKALASNKVTLSIGNLFGSNAFNILLAVGIPGLFGAIALDARTYEIGVPVLAVASFIFLIIGLARKLYRWEGIMFLIFYVFFLLKLMGL